MVFRYDEKRDFFIYLSVLVTFDTLQQLLQEAFPHASITLSGDLYHVHIHLCDPSFAGLGRLKRDQQVYQHLQPLIASGALHAVTLKTAASEQGGV